MGSDWNPPNWPSTILDLEIYADRAGWTAVPPFHMGKSGNCEKFKFLAMDGTYYCGFDIYENVREEDVRETYRKKKETGVYTVIINLHGETAERVARLADDLGISILSREELKTFFLLCSGEMKNPPR